VVTYTAIFVVDPAVPFSCLSPVLLTMRTAVPAVSEYWLAFVLPFASWLARSASVHAAGEIMV